MNTTSQQKPTRAEETQEGRRRRQDTGPLAGLNLNVAEEDRDPNYEYRWINDTGNRVENKTKRDDWDIVRTEPTLVDKTPRSGAPMKAYLVRKRKDFQQEDQAKRMARLQEQEDSIRRGVVNDPKGLSGPSAYVPEGGISIRSGK